MKLGEKIFSIALFSWGFTKILERLYFKLVHGWVEKAEKRATKGPEVQKVIQERKQFEAQIKKLNEEINKQMAHTGNACITPNAEGKLVIKGNASSSKIGAFISRNPTLVPFLVSAIYSLGYFGLRRLFAAESPLDSGREAIAGAALVLGGETFENMRQISFTSQYYQQNNKNLRDAIQKDKNAKPASSPAGKKPRKNRQ